MRFFKKFLWPLLLTVFITTLARGFLLWLEETQQIYVDRYVATMIGVAESMVVQAPSWVGWTLAGLAGLASMAGWYFFSSKRLKREKKTIRVNNRLSADLSAALPEFKISQLVRLVLNLDKFDVPGAYEEIGRLLHDIRQKAIYGTITIWGRENCNEDWEDQDIIPRTEISKTYWKNNKINESVFGTKNGRTVTVNDDGTYDFTYSDLAISLDQARKAWPGAYKDGEDKLLAPVILAELETTVAPIEGLTPACAVRITNLGPELECLVQIEDHGSKVNFPDPFVVRSEGQIRGNRTGRFILSPRQTQLVPIFFKIPAHLGHFRFIGEDGENYDFVLESLEFVVAIYGADNPTKVRVRLSNGQDYKPKYEMEYC